MKFTHSGGRIFTLTPETMEEQSILWEISLHHSQYGVIAPTPQRGYMAVSIDMANPDRKLVVPDEKESRR